MAVIYRFCKVKIFTIFLFLFFCGHSYALLPAKTYLSGELFFNLNVVVSFNNSPLEGVQLELTKDGVTISSVKTDKYGKFKFKIPYSSVNENNEYLLLISKPGMITKKLSVNTYLPQIEVDKGNTKFRFELTITMTELTQKDIILVNPSGKLKWDYDKRDFSFDQQYAKIAKKEEELFLKSPEKYAEYIDSQKKKPEKVNETELKGKIDKETENLNAGKSAKEKALKDNTEIKDNRMNAIDEAAGLDLQQKKEESSNKNAEIIEILAELKEIKKETEPKLNKELVKETKLRVNKDIKYNGENRFSTVLKAAEEKEMGGKKDKPQKKKPQNTPNK